MNEQQHAAIERLKELEKQASHSNWEIGLASKFICSRDKDTGIFHAVGDINRIEDSRLVCALRNDGMPLLEALATENERLRQGLKDTAEKYAEMEKLRSQFYTEKEQAETALLFANRENERLRAGVEKAIKDLKHISNCAEQMGETAEHVFGNAIKELEALHDA